MNGDLKRGEPARWICCQLGAREHYAVPRALHSGGVLERLFTDAWVRPGSLLGRCRRSWRERFHPALASASVASANGALLRFELVARLRGLHGWERTMARNQWFQQQALTHLSTLATSSPISHLPSSSLAASPPTVPPTLFAYSYAALELFRLAKARGWRTVLGQIDAGPAMERAYVAQEDRYPATGMKRIPPPPSYWRAWQEECALADRIIVNSPWSREALVAAQVASEKIDVVPLAYEAPPESAGFRRVYPATFSAQRPLRILFLGQVNLLKGIMPLLEAARTLAAEPVEFWIVGPEQLCVPAEFRSQPQIRWLGPVPRGAVATYYREADVFLFPTFSDGFGLTQLEAQAWQLPVIASRCCGEVVQDGVNGLVLPEVTAEAIATALRSCLLHPERLREFSRSAVRAGNFGLESLTQKLRQLDV